MKKFLIVFLSILLFSAVGLCDSSGVDYEGVSTGPGGGGGCAESTLISQTNHAGSAGYLADSVYSRGQAFTNPDESSHEISKVAIYIDSDNMEAEDEYTLTLRIGDSDDFTTYDGSGTLLIADGTTGEVEITLDSTVTLGASATKYFGMQWGGAFADLVYIGIADSDVYASHSQVRDPSTGAWDMSGSSTTTDLYFKIIICDT